MLGTVGKHYPRVFGTVQTVARKHKVGTVPVKVLDGVSGVLRPGRLTLLMGPPGAGKSVFLKVRPADVHMSVVKFA